MSPQDNWPDRRPLFVSSTKTTPLCKAHQVDLEHEPRRPEPPPSKPVAVLTWRVWVLIYAAMAVGAFALGYLTTFNR